MARILVIDDDAQIRSLLRKALEKEGHEVSEAPDGSVGTLLYRDNPADLVITDIVMPEKDGWQTIVELRREYPEVKCIGISGGAEIGPFSYLMIAKRFGAMRVFSKPLKLTEMLVGIREVLAGKQNHKQGVGSAARQVEETKSILLVDPDPEHSWILCEGLTRAGHSVTDTRKPEYAFEIMSKRSFEVAIVDVLSARFQDTDLIQCLRVSWTAPLIILMADFESSAVRKAVITRGGDHLLGKPVDTEHLLTIISPPSGFSGRVDGVDILEYLQFLLLTGKKMLIEIRPRQGDPCRLYIGGEKILHATCGKSEGESAFYRCIFFKGGEFVNLPWSEPEKISIDKIGDCLLMEAARRRDEAR